MGYAEDSPFFQAKIAKNKLVKSQGAQNHNSILEAKL